MSLPSCSSIPLLCEAYFHLLSAPPLFDGWYYCLVADVGAIYSIVCSWILHRQLVVMHTTQLTTLKMTQHPLIQLDAVRVCSRGIFWNVATTMIEILQTTMCYLLWLIWQKMKSLDLKEVKLVLKMVETAQLQSLPESSSQKPGFGTWCPGSILTEYVVFLPFHSIIPLPLHSSNNLFSSPPQSHHILWGFRWVCLLDDCA